MIKVQCQVLVSFTTASGDLYSDFFTTWLTWGKLEEEAKDFVIAQEAMVRKILGEG
jgi:hypothetical protein